MFRYCYVVLVMFFPAWAAQASPQVGVYEGNGCAGVTAAKTFTTWSGHAPQHVLDFVPFTSWTAMINDAGWTTWCWQQSGAPPLTISVPLTVNNVSLASIAAGVGDAYFIKIAQAFVTTGYGSAIIRLGWEMNGGWYPWGGLNGQNWHDKNGHPYVNSVQDYFAAFAHVVAVLRGVSPNFRIEWCPSGGNDQVGQSDLYPGDDVVDIIGSDLYAIAMPWGTANPSAAQVEAYFNQGWQFDWISGFARKHGKPISFPEVGIGDRPNGSNNLGPGDSPAVMAYVLDWFAAHSAAPGQPAGPGQLEYFDIWDYNAGDYNSKVSDGERPNEGAVLRASLGPATVITPPAPDTIAINLTANPWKGAALANVSIDGTGMAWGLAVNANILNGQMQTFTYSVPGASSHAVVVTFTNDAWGGTPTTDRNLYVEGITVNGQAQANTTATLLRNGSVHFTVQ